MPRFGGSCLLPQNCTHGCCLQVVSCDAKGFIKYWDAETYAFPSSDVSFKSMFATSLMDCVKDGCFAKSLAISRDGRRFAISCSDMSVRVFAYASGKLLCRFDASMEVRLWPARLS